MLHSLQKLGKTDTYPEYRLGPFRSRLYISLSLIPFNSVYLLAIHISITVKELIFAVLIPRVRGVPNDV